MESRVAVLAATFCWGAFAQSTSVPHHGEATFAAATPVSPRSVKTGAPYSAEEVGEDIQTLADGTNITRTNATTKVYRDSLGRTRRERPLMYSGAKGDWPQAVEIVDPVAQFKYVLDVSNRIAHRQQLLIRPETQGKPAVREKPAEETQGPSNNVEQLGKQTIEGVEAEGTHVTTTYPIGSVGNDRPLTVVGETWMSRELGVTVLSKHNDPRSGEYIQKLVNISLTEPPASLFQVPGEYTVVDEAGAFSIPY
jgi:hypothetical protein